MKQNIEMMHVLQETNWFYVCDFYKYSDSYTDFWTYMDSQTISILIFQSITSAGCDKVLSERICVVLWVRWGVQSLHDRLRHDCGLELCQKIKKYKQVDTQMLYLSGAKYGLKMAF